MLSLRSGAAASLLVVLGLGSPSPAGARQNTTNQSTGPTLSGVALHTIDGQSLEFEQLRGRVVLLDFWATWCAPCLAEMPRLKRLYAAYPREDFMLVGISLDGSDRRMFTSWLRRNRIGWPQVQDARGYNGDLARRFAVETLPVTLLFDRDGRLAHRDLRGPRLESAIRALAEPATRRDTPR
jgi:thiol-disulfide isomerase/thioredoxin